MQKGIENADYGAKKRNGYQPIQNHLILHGEISSELTDDSRGIRFVVLGNTQDEARSMEVVCRFLPSGLLRIITVYQIEE